MPSISIRTNQRLCFWGAPAQLPPDVRVINDCLRETGNNTGNIFIGNGLHSATNAKSKEYWNFYFGSPAEFDEKFDALFVPASNFIFQFTDLNDQYQFFRQTKAQIFMFGLGSQLRELGPITIPPGTENFIRLAADRSTSIGVRGEITAEVVQKMGIKNVDVTGCPSMLNIPDAFSAVPRFTDHGLRIAGNFTSHSREHAFSETRLKELESSLFAELLQAQGFYVLQNEDHVIELMTRLKTVNNLDENDLYNLRCVKSLFSLQAEDNAEIIRYLRWRTRLFFSVFEWCGFMRNMDFSFGTRFHGNVAAIMAGRPAHIICHDYRTLELAQFYKLPHSVVDNYSAIPKLSEIMENSDMNAFRAHIPELMNVWASFIRRNGYEAELSS